MVIPNSLVATVKNVRPDLADVISGVEATSPIPEEPPLYFFAKHEDYIEDIGAPTNPCFFVNSKTDPSNWYHSFPCAMSHLLIFSPLEWKRWIFEKYDGVRGFWNPLKKAFYSRKGNKFLFPQEVIDAMPTNAFLDGELWYSYHAFIEFR